MNSYELSRSFIDFAFDNPEKISPNHYAVYFFAIEHCNRLGWKKKFGFPSQMTMDAIGIKKNQTYTRYFNDLVDWGFFELIEKSKNQYSSNIISLQSATPKKGKALDKAFIRHGAKQLEGMGSGIGQSNSTIDKPINNEPLTTKPINNEPEGVVFPFDSIEFKKSWSTWKDYKQKEHKFKYKTATSEQAALIKLNKISDGDEKKAVEIINESLANGWQGFFELKEKNNGNTKNGHNRLTEEKQAYLMSRTDL